MHALETSLQRIGKAHQEHAVEIHGAADVEKNDEPVLSGLSSFVGQNDGLAATHDASPDASAEIYAIGERVDTQFPRAAEVHPAQKSQRKLFQRGQVVAWHFGKI